MKKTFMLLLVFILLSGLYGCSGSSDSPNIIVNSNIPDDYHEILEDVLSNKKLFITEAGSAAYLKDYTICKEAEKNTKAVPRNFAYVDSDGDSMDELVVSVSESEIYLIFHYNGHDVFGYEMQTQSFNSLRADGTYSESNGANIRYFYRLRFNNRKLDCVKDAVYDADAGIFQVGKKNVTEEEILAFISEWDQKPGVVWTNMNSSDDIVSETTIPSAPQETGDNSDTIYHPAPPQHTINLNEYVILEFYGYDGAGMASVRLDQAKFLADNASVIAFRNESARKEYYASTGDTSAPAEVLFSLINKLSLTTEELLSNGDVVSLLWKVSKTKIDKYFSLNIAYHTETYTVSDLTIPEKFNPLDYIQVNYTGIAPCGSVQLTIDSSGLSDSKLSEKILYACSSKNYTLAEQIIYQPGQEITVYYNAVDLNDRKSLAKYIDTYGLVPTCTEKTFVLSGFNYHPTTLSQMNLSILEDARNICTQKIDADPYLTPKSISLSRVYYATPNAEAYDSNSKWSLYAVFNVEANATFWNLQNAPTITQNINFCYVVELRSPQITQNQATIYTTSSTNINPIGPNAGAGIVFWEVNGQLYNSPPNVPSENVIEHCCYPDGFASVTEADRAIRNRGGQIECLDY